MGKRCAFVAVLLLLWSVSSFALAWEFGGILSGGLDLGSAAGTYFDAKSAQLAALGSSAPGTLGTTRPDILPGFTVGGYAELDFIDWLGVRFEPRVSLMGSSFLAINDAGAAFDRYGAFFFGLLLPLYARGIIPLGPGAVTVMAGGFYGVVFGSVALSDRYASSATTAWIPLETEQLEFYGASGGLGYSLQLGPGIAALELRADWALTPISFTTGSTGGELHPLGVVLAAGYGIRIGGAE
jgi:hypothetical protein